MSLPANAADRTLTAVLRDIEEGKTVPCYLLCGEEEFLLSDALERIIDLLLSPDSRDLNLFIIHSDEDLDFFFNTVSTPPLLPGRKVILRSSVPV